MEEGEVRGRVSRRLATAGAPSRERAKGAIDVGQRGNPAREYDGQAVGGDLAEKWEMIELRARYLDSLAADPAQKPRASRTEGRAKEFEA